MKRTTQIGWTLLVLMLARLDAAAAPQAPAGLHGSLSAFQRAFTLTWEPATAAARQQVAGYNIYRRARLDGAAERINPNLVTVPAYADRVDGQIFFYTVRAVDDAGQESAESFAVDSSADCNLVFSAAGGDVTVSIPAAAGGIFYSYGNSLHVPLTLRVSQAAPASRNVLRDLSIVYVRSDTGEEISDVGFGLGKVRVRIGYSEAAQATAAVGGAAVRPSLYWYNGLSWIRTGNATTANSGVIDLETAQLGRFQLRLEAAAGTATPKASIYPNVITPNGDGLNDRAFVMLEGFEAAAGEVFDRFGRRVASLHETSVAGNATLSWDGRDDAGNAVGSDLYVIRVMQSGRPLMATVAVAR